MDTQTVRVDGRYLPIRYPEELPYWEATLRSELVIPECSSCGYLFHPVGPVCPRCLSDRLGWRQVSGKGTVTSYVVYHKGWSGWLRDHIPYTVAQVELDEGPRLTAGLVDIAPDELAVGIRVEAVFEKVTDEIALVQFRRAATTA